MDKNARVNQVALTSINLSSATLSLCCESLDTADIVIPEAFVCRSEPDYICYHSIRVKAGTRFGGLLFLGDACTTTLFARCLTTNVL